MHGNVVSEYCSRKWRKALRPQPWILCGNGGIPVPCPREKREAAEALLIGPHGLLSTQSTGRPTPEPPCEMRTCFQRDVDRITHSKSFRRLKHKTQVFLRPEGDHYRTRLTHTLEVARLARTIARALELNEDLTEAISLGHDLGHTPFGHAGERALNAIYTGVGFRHYEQSLRVVDRIERDGRGLNLCNETRIGILNHTTGQPRGTLEADLAASQITFYRLQCDSDGVLRSYIAEGEILPVKTGSFGGIGIFAIPEMGRFYRHVLIQKRYPHHGAVAFGHYGKLLFEVFKFLGVGDIAYNQPKSLPYPTENPFA